MAEATFDVAVLVERRRLASPWADYAFVPVAALPGAPDTPAWTVIGESDHATRFYAGHHAVELHRAETGNYRDNLASGRPLLWVALGPGESEPGVALLAVTADPAEGEAWTETGTLSVEAVEMPAELQALLAAFVAEHHVEQAFFKRKRDRADPEAGARRRPIREPEGR